MDTSSYVLLLLAKLILDIFLFPRDSLCSDCVSSVCSQIRFKFRLSEDDKAIKAILKAKVDPQR